MRECWLRPNRRLIGIGLIPPLLLVGLGLWLVFGGWPAGPYLVLRWVGGLLAAASAWLCFNIVLLLAQPRLAYDGAHLVLYLKPGQPQRVPIETVEVFFKGQASSAMRGPDGREPEVCTIVVRVAESAKEFHHAEVPPRVGLWCEGYVTIRGTYCEPITPELILGLNRKLVQAHRARRELLSATPS